MKAVRLPVALGLLVIYLVWGSTYLAIRVGLETIPPFMLAGVRFSIAGAILFGVGRLKDRERITLRHWLNAAIFGALLLVVGNGGLVWAEQRASTGLAALFLGTVPLWTVILGRATGSDQGSLLGVAFGLGGLALLVFSRDGTLQVETTDALILILTAIGQAGGTVFARRAALPASPYLRSAMAMISGGAVLSSIAFARGERLDPSHVSAASAGALAYLVAMGSLFAFTVFAWLTKAATPSIVSTYAYVNPVIAMILGAVFLGETIAPRAALAAVLIFAGVATLYLKRPKTHSTTPRRSSTTAPYPPAVERGTVSAWTWESSAPASRSVERRALCASPISRARSG